MVVGAPVGVTFDTLSDLIVGSTTVSPSGVLTNVVKNGTHNVCTDGIYENVTLVRVDCQKDCAGIVVNFTCSGGVHTSATVVSGGTNVYKDDRFEMFGSHIYFALAYKITHRKSTSFEKCLLLNENPYFFT